MPKKNGQPDTIYERQQIRNFVKDAMSRVGGKSGFQFIGPAARRAVIQAACWEIIRSAATATKITITGKQMFAFEQAMCEEAGIWGEGP